MDQSCFERNKFISSLLCKSLYLFLILKILFLWPIITDIAENAAPQIGTGIRSLIFLPLVVAKPNYQVLMALFLAILIFSLIIKINYFSGIFIFWFSLSFSKLIFSVANGSDLILNIFLFIAIFLSTTPRFSWGIQYQIILSNAALLLGQVQIALIYLLSGCDKLTSVPWRSGGAVHSITNLTFFQNPFFHLELSESQCFILSWLIILFELAFPALVWFKKFRIPMLVIGVIFHLGIVIFLGLADFGLVMILCYSVFLGIKSEDKKLMAVTV